MKKKWKKIMAAWCAATMLVTMPGTSALAEELADEAIITVAENPYQETNALAEREMDVEVLADDVSNEEDVVIKAESVEQENPEEIVGVKTVTVGDGVTATFDENTGDIELYSNGGTLWKDWLDKSGIEKLQIKSIRVASGTVYLPKDSSRIFSIYVGYEDTIKVVSNLSSLDMKGFNTSNVTNMSGMFYNCIILTSLDLSGFDTSNVTNMSDMFYDCNYLSELNLSSFNTSNVTDMSKMFFGCWSLTSLNLRNFNTSKVKSMYDMFEYCTALTSLDVSSFDTSNVTDMNSMFSCCSGLTNLDVSSFDTSNVTDMSYMFSNCNSLTSLDVSSFDTSNVTGIAFMFWYCTNLTRLNLSSFNTSNVTDMSYMFSNCNGLTRLDVSSFDTSNVTEMIDMFSCCTGLTGLNLSSFDTSNVQDMSDMFNACSSLTNLNLSSFDTSKVACFGDMFYNCPNIEVLRTPKKQTKSGVMLPITMYDNAGKGYTELPVLSNSIVLGKTQTIAFEHEAQNDTNYFSLFRGDNNGYEHATYDFYKPSEEQCYQTSYYRNLKKYIKTVAEEERLLDVLNNPWRGSCFGAAVSMVLKNLGIEDISSTNSYYSLGKPCDNKILRDVINYYHICSILNDYSADYYTDRHELSGLVILFTYYVSQKHFFEYFIAEAQRSQTERKPFVFNYRYKDKGKKTSSGHSVIVCGLEKEDYDSDNVSEYKVKIYDLNCDKENPRYIYMYVEEDFRSFHFQDMNHIGGSSLEDTWTGMSYVGIDKLENDPFYRIDKNERRVETSEYETVVGASDNGDKDNQYATVIMDADKPFVLENDQGKTLLYDGEYSGNLEIYAIDFIIDETPRLKLKVLSSDKFIISGITDDFSVAADVDGKYYRASTSGANEIILNKDGIEIDGDDDYSFTAAVGTEMKNHELIQVSSFTNGKILVFNEGETVSVTSESPMQSIVVNAISEDQNNELEYTGDENSVYIGEDDGVIQIGDVEILNGTITLSSTNYTYDGKEKEPTITVKYGTVELSQGTDYLVTYTNNTSAGTATVKVTGTGNYKGEKTVTFTINKADSKLVFAESILTKKTTDTAFTNALTKTTDGTVTFKSSDTNVAIVNSMSGHVTIKGAGTATITATASEGKNYKAGNIAYTLIVKAPPTPTPTPTSAAAGFSDVQDLSHPYYKAIYWAAGEGITKGYSDGTFGINRSCTRGEMMMFLWRYAGKPAPKNVSKSPFKDVPKTHTFYKAILWGSQKGITKGYADGTFGINRNVSRGECMMFLWRLKGKPAPKAVAKAPFPDVPKSHVFYNAVLWGYQKKITTGFTSGKLKGKFGVNENCSRGQIVTFLYRAK